MEAARIALANVRRDRLSDRHALHPRSQRKQEPISRGVIGLRSWWGAGSRIV